MNPRILKIEEEGDFWRKATKPKIRLTGRWLEQMGFPPHRYVEVSMIQPGVLQLRLKPEADGQETQSNGDTIPSFEECMDTIEHLEHEARTAFSPAWRHRCKREIAEWEAFVAKHYPGRNAKAVSKSVAPSATETASPVKY